MARTKYSSRLFIIFFCFVLLVRRLHSFSVRAVPSAGTSFIRNGSLCSPARRQYSLRFSTESEEDQEETPSPLEAEMNDLRSKISWIEALEERNRAQIESFVDEQDQWDSMEPEEREVLQAKESFLARMETLSEELIQIWIEAKSKDG